MIFSDPVIKHKKANFFDWKKITPLIFLVT
jgi:hypothetical protein